MTTPFSEVPPIAFARSEILVPFTYDPKDPQLETFIKSSPFWSEGGAFIDGHKGLNELLPHFQRLMKGPNQSGDPKTSWRRLYAHREAVTHILRRLSVRAATPEQKKSAPEPDADAEQVPRRSAPGRLTGLEATLFSTGEGLLCFEFTWSKNGPIPTPTELAESLPLIRRAKGNPAQPFHPIWSFKPLASKLKPDNVTPADRKNETLRTGPEPDGGTPADQKKEAEARAKREAFAALVKRLSSTDHVGRLQLTDIASILFERAVDVAPTGLTAIHTSVILASPPTPGTMDTIDRALFHYVHAAPPSFVCPDDVRAHTQILTPRGNRRIAIAREGVTVMGWPPADGASHESDVQWARGRFHGVYRLLHMHVHAERLAIAGLNDDAAKFAEKLDDQHLLAHQGEIESLLVEVTRYTLSLTGEDCGGNGDHVAFFSALRGAHRIPQQRDELRAEIDELRALLRAVENRRSQRADDDERTFQRAVSSIGFIAVPLAIAAGVLGINVEHGDEALLFSPFAAIGIGVGLLAVSAAFYMAYRRRLTNTDAQEPRDS